MTDDMLFHERILWSQGCKYVAGIDEAGRGPLAGPVVAACVILDPNNIPSGVNDSKKLSEKKREALYDEICEKAIAYCVVLGSVEEINETDILSTTLHAMRRAIDGLSVKADFALIDGNQTRGFTLPCRPVIHGDAISPSIAAASILAKVTRDRICMELDAAYPQYGIAKHKGYGTKAHMDALREHGPCEIYRTKFIRFLDQ